MANYNKVILMGHLVKNIELKQGSISVAKSTIAVNSKYKDKETAMFVDIVIFGKSAEILSKYADKGSNLLIEGKLSQNVWDDKGTGQKRSKHEIIVDTFQLIGKKKEAAPNDDAIDDDDIPF